MWVWLATQVSQDTSTNLSYGASFSMGKSSWDLLQRTWNRGRFYTLSAVFRKCKQKNTVLNKIAAPSIQWKLALNNSTRFVKIWVFSYQIFAIAIFSLTVLDLCLVLLELVICAVSRFTLFWFSLSLILIFKLLILLDFPDVLFMTKATEYGEV